MIRQLPPELQELASNKDPKRTEEDILAIKEWLKKQPHLTCRTDDQWILSFLRGCNFSLERTKEKIDTYLTLKAFAPEFYSNRDPMRPELQEVFKTGILLHLKTADFNSRAINLFRIGRWDPKKIDSVGLMKCCFMNEDVAFAENDRLCLSGATMVVDLKDLASDHVLNVNLTAMKKAITCQLNAYPLSSQAVLFINAPSSFDSFYKVLGSMSGNYKVYGTDLTEFYKQVPLAALPNEYGGEAGHIDELVTKWNEKVQSYRNWLIEDEKYKADEKKRRGRAKTSSEMFGIEGSFRILDLD